MKSLTREFLIISFAVLLISGCTSPSVTSGVFTAKPSWTFETDDTIISTPVIYDGLMIVRTEKKIYAVDATTRQSLWVNNSSGSINGSAPPLIADGIVVVPEDSNPIAAFSLTDGALIWRKCHLDLWQEDCSHASPGFYVDDLQNGQDILTVSDFDGNLIAYNVHTGDVLWSVKTPGRGGPSIAIDKDTVFFDKLTVSNTVELWALDLITGNEKWHLNVDDVMGKMVAKDGVLYYTVGVDDTARATAVRQDNASVLWNVRVNGGLGSKDTYISVDDELLFVAGTQLTAISKEAGEIVWRTGDHAGFMRPIIAGSLVLVRDQHLLYAFDKRTGVELGRLSLEISPGRKNVELNPAIYGDFVVIPVGAKQLATYQLAVLEK